MPPFRTYLSSLRWKPVFASIVVPLFLSLSLSLSLSHSLFGRSWKIFFREVRSKIAPRLMSTDGFTTDCLKNGIKIPEKVLLSMDFGRVFDEKEDQRASRCLLVHLVILYS